MKWLIGIVLAGRLRAGVRTVLRNTILAAGLAAAVTVGGVVLAAALRLFVS